MSFPLRCVPDHTVVGGTATCRREPAIAQGEEVFGRNPRSESAPLYRGRPTSFTSSANRGSERMGSSRKSVLKPFGRQRLTVKWRRYKSNPRRQGSAENEGPVGAEYYLCKRIAPVGCLILAP